MTQSPTRHAVADAALDRRDLAAASAALRSVLTDDPDDFEGWMKLAAVNRLAQDLDGAMAAVDEALRLRPLFYLPLLLKGSMLRRTGNVDAAAEICRAALFQAETESAISPAVRHQLADAAVFVRTHDATINAQVAHALSSTMGEMDDREHRRAVHFADNILRRRKHYHQEPTHFRYPGLPDTEFFDDHFLDLRARAEAMMNEILGEYLLASGDAAAFSPYVDFRPGVPVGQWASLNRSSSWNALHLVRYGEVIAANAERCPLTMSCMTGSARPDVAGVTPNLMFSVLAPHTHIPPHTGVANFRVVLHLPLIVPEGCRFRVGNEVRSWKVGEAWVFDDTIEHEAWNDSDQPRVILIADLWRPELGQRDRDIVRTVMGALSLDEMAGAL